MKDKKKLKFSDYQDNNSDIYLFNKVVTDETLGKYDVIINSCPGNLQLLRDLIMWQFFFTT